MCRFFFTFCYKQFSLLTIWERPRARTESFKIPNFRKLFTLKMAFSNGKSNKKVVFYETRELPWASVGFRAGWKYLFLQFVPISLYVHIYMHTNSYIYPRLYMYIYIFFLIPLVTRHLSPHDLGETTSSDRKFQNPGFSSSFDPKKGIF